MFDISFGELLLVVVLAVVFVGPKELPVVVRAVARGVIHLKKFIHEVQAMMNDLAREAGVDDIRREIEEEFTHDTTLIQGDDGKWYESYNIDDFIRPETKIIEQPKEQNIPKVNPEAEANASEKS